MLFESAESAKNGRAERKEETYSFYHVIEVAFAAKNSTSVSDDPVAERDETCGSKEGSSSAPASPKVEDRYSPALCAGLPSKISSTCQTYSERDSDELQVASGPRDGSRTCSSAC